MLMRTIASALGLALLSSTPAFAAESHVGPTGFTLTVSNTTKTIAWPRPLIPALETNELRYSGVVNGPYPFLATNVSVSPGGYLWTENNSAQRRFYSLTLGQMSSNKLFSANVLNRLSYGPTPDESEYVATYGPQAFISQQVAQETIPNTVDQVITLRTNSGSSPTNLGWTSLTVTGAVTTPRLYMYLIQPGQVSIDNVEMRYSHVLTSVTNDGSGYVTNVFTNVSANLIVNGDFESGWTNGWTVSSILTGSYVDTVTNVFAGTGSLRMVSSGAGITQGSSIWQALPAAPATMRGTNGLGFPWTNTVSTVRGILSFAYLPSADSDLLTMRLSGSGLIISGAEAPPEAEWIYATATGTATATPALYIYLSGAGECSVDDMKLVSGSVAGVGPNLLSNGNFESPLATGWQTTADFTNSYTDATTAISGGSSLRIVATAAGGGSGDAIIQSPINGLTNGQTYTVSYWYRPATRSRTLTVRLSGSALNSTPDSLPGMLKNRLEREDWSVSLDEMRRWFCYNAVASPAQLHEILTQFFENHFVTYHSKTADYMDRFYDGGIMDRIATTLEYHEVSRWRQALLNPDCTFHDLLKIHVESPAQIIYLDTVESRGDGTRIANENYARELFELFTMGVDNGYDQDDIVAMSRAWTGWTVDLVRKEDAGNPFAPRDANRMQYGFYPGVGFQATSNRVGVWSFVFDPNWHGTNRQPILSTWNTNMVATGPKRYAARFGAPWANQSYQIVLPQNRTGTNGIQDGYDVIASLANNIHTAEYVSVKLCRLFIHDEFPNPTTHVGTPEYDFYNYTNPSRSAEAELVRQCIVAWDTPVNGRKGNIRAVLNTIFNSALFRSHPGSMQKVKTPLEFVISSVRAMYSRNPDGTATAFTDGSFRDQLSRMGSMSLFNRAEPDGYPESAAPWISAGTLAERLRYVQALCSDPGQTGGRPSDAGSHTVDPVALIQKKLPGTSWQNPGAIADYFLALMFPGEGAANLDLYRASAVAFLNDGSADPTPGSTPFTSLTVSGTATSAYDLRVRGMVSMLMTFQRFQEQ